MKIEIGNNIDNIYGNIHVCKNIFYFEMILLTSGKIQVNKEREKEQKMKTVLQRKGVFIKVNISKLGCKWTAFLILNSRLCCYGILFG